MKRRQKRLLAYEINLKQEKISKLFANQGSVRIVENCDLGFDNAALNLRPRATAYSRPRSQFFTIRTLTEIFLFLAF